MVTDIPVMISFVFIVVLLCDRRHPTTFIVDTTGRATFFRKKIYFRSAPTRPKPYVKSLPGGPKSMACFASASIAARAASWLGLDREAASKAATVGAANEVPRTVT